MYTNLFSFDCSEVTGLCYASEFGANKIQIFDLDWRYNNTISFNQPTGIKILANFIYIATVTQIQKFSIENDFNTPLITSVIAGIYSTLEYDQSKDVIVTININNNSITYFDKNLTYLNSLDLPNNTPRLISLAFFNQKIYAGTYTNVILVIENSTILATYSNICRAAGGLSAIYIDFYGYMAVGCQYDYYIYLYHTNGTNIGLYLNITNSLTSIRFDTKDRLVAIGGSQILIFY